MENKTITNKERFLELYSKVFDTNGNTKACGRELCKELIKAAVKLNRTNDYGNIDTGIMNVENIKALKAVLYIL